MEIQSSNLFNQTTPIDGDDIPDWLLFELLLRLPLNSVFTCRIVSKRWLSLASDPSFIRAYAARGLFQPPWTIRSSSYYSPDETYSTPYVNIILRDINLRPRLHTIQPYEWHAEAGKCFIVGVSDGLVLYRSRSGRSERNFYVCNPITGHRIKVIKPASSRWENSMWPMWGFLTRVNGEFTLKSYRIVEATLHTEDLNAVIFNVYYSEIDDWKEFTVLYDGPSLDKLDMQGSAAVVDGILYWADADWEHSVIAYNPDLSPERMRLIPCPSDLVSRDVYLRSCLCLEYGGELRYFAGFLLSDKLLPSFSIWKLEDLSSGEWCLLHNIWRMEVGRDHIFFGVDMEMDIVCFDPFDPDMVYLIDEDTEWTYSFNLKSGLLLEDVSDFWFNLDTLKFDYSYYLSVRYRLVPPLVVPPWPTNVSKKHLERL